MNALHTSSWRLTVAVLVGGTFLAAAAAAEPITPVAKPAIRALLQAEVEGVTYSALVLPAPATRPSSAEPHEHLVVVDTSASQAGAFRQQTLNVLRNFVAQLPQHDKIQLLATDVETELLTTGAVAPGSAGYDKGLLRLEERVPLGSTNLELALRTALKSAATPHSKSLVYIGDGMSSSKLLASDTLRQLTKDLVAAQLPVISVAVGPQVDLALLGTLAQHTGGSVLTLESKAVAGRDLTNAQTAEVGRTLAVASRAPVLFQTSFKSQPAVTEWQPQNFPPIRFDRETVVILKGFKGARLQMNAWGTFAGKTTHLSWNLERNDTTTHPYLARLWDLAARDQGLSFPWADAALLATAQQAFETEMAQLVDTAEQELGHKRLAAAEGILAALKKVAPERLEVTRLATATANLKAKLVANQPAEEEAPAEEAPATEAPTTEAPAPSAGLDDTNDADDTSSAPTRSLIDDLENRRQIREEQLSSDVDLALQSARLAAQTDVEAALDDLKRQMNTVISATDISADVRDGLRTRLEALRYELEGRKIKLDQEQVAVQRQLSLLEDQKRATDVMRRDEEKMEQLLERARTLIRDGERGNVDAFERSETVGRVAVELSPTGAAANAAVFNAEAYGQLDKSRRLRSLRQDRFLETLHQVELSHVPFPDEPPQIWPAPEVWQRITEMRRKWKSVDLKSYSKKEERIISALDETTSLEFTDETLEAVVLRIKERHGFDIIIMKADLEADSITIDDPVYNLSVADITLRNALKLLLDDKQLTYLIENEVMKITTVTKAGNSRPIRAYYAADLTIPVNPLLGMSGGGGLGGALGGGGMGGGGMGGMGGGMGGMGGGMGGMGGGMGMGGGGFFNVPAQNNKAPVKANGVKAPAAKAPKAKPAGKPLAHAAVTSQAFAQVKEDAPALNSKTLQDRKKKPLPSR